MSSLRNLIQAFVLAATLSPLLGAEPVARRATAPALFDDPVVARGKGVEVRQSEVDDMYTSFRANRASAGQTIPPSQRPAIEAEILDKLIATRLCLQRATEADKAKGEQIAKEFIAEQMKQLPSEESFNRQLLVSGLTPEQFRTQVTEQAIVKAVLDRQVRDRKPTSDAEAKKFYDDNPKLFEQPEMVRVTHILLSTLDADTNQELSGEKKLQKRELAERLLKRAKDGDDFAKLVAEFSEDKNAKARNGEYVISRSDRRYVLPPEFEGAAFSLPTNRISEIIVSPFGYHIIKCLEKIPAKKSTYAEVADKIKETLQQEAVQKDLPEFINRLRKESGVEILKRSESK